MPVTRTEIHKAKSDPCNIKTSNLRLALIVRRRSARDIRLPMNPIPLSRIRSIVKLIRRQLRRLFIVLLFRQQKIENQRRESRHGKTGLQNQFDGVEEPDQSAVVA